MAFSNMIMNGFAIVSVALAGASGIQTGKKFLAPIPIQGHGEYSEPVKAGDTVPVVWSILKQTDCHGIFGRVWEGANGFYVIEAQRPSGLPTTTDYREYNIQTHIPSLAPFGELHLSIVGEYDCGSGGVPFRLGPVILEVIE